MRTIPFALALFLFFAFQIGMSQESALNNASLEEIAERFFPIFIEGKDTLQTFEISDTIRSFTQNAAYKAAVKQFNQMFGGVGELKKKGMIQPGPTIRTVELFYSGKTNSFMASVTFTENQITGVWFKPWTDEPAHGGTPIQLQTPTGTLYGTLLEPEKATKPVPIVLFLSGSGPTDRNGNQLPTLHTDAFRLLAEALQQNGVASVRFDKRGVGASAEAGRDESKLRFEHYVDDAVLWIGLLSQEKKYSKIIVLGHSEGSLIGMLACIPSKNVDGFISLCGAGRPIDEVIREQMKGQPPSVKDSLFPILDELKKGKTVEKVPEVLLSLVRPSVQPYVISQMRYDPQKEIKKLTLPVLIVQGTTDIQVLVNDADKLSEANPQAKKVVVKNMNHTLKKSETTIALLQQPCYTDPKYPIHEDLVPSLTEFIAAVR